MNPFITRGYAGKRLFCDREAETNRLLNALQNRRDVTLVSLRKMGKTGLILHLFGILEKERSVETIYLDILQTENLNGLINQLATALARRKKTFGQKVQDYLTALRHLHPVLSVDPLSGLPALSVQISGEKEAEATLGQMFGLLADNRHKIPVVVAIDEFQQIGHYPEKNTEALLRGIIQGLPNMTFLFSGSSQSMLSRMFGDASRPFYQSAEMMFLEPINEKSYASFIAQQFHKNGRNFDPGVVQAMMQWTRSHTWYTQYACNRLFETGMDVTDDAWHEVMADILNGFEPFYNEYRTLVTGPQWQMLKAIAHAEPAESITSGEFLRRYSLTNASTVRRSVEALLAKEMIYRKEGRLFIYDVFFGRWLQRLTV